MIEQHNDSLLKELARLSQALINSLTDIQLPQMVQYSRPGSLTSILFSSDPPYCNNEHDIPIHCHYSLFTNN